MNLTHVYFVRDEEGFKEVRIRTHFKPDSDASSKDFNNLPKTGHQALNWIIEDLTEMLNDG